MEFTRVDFDVLVEVLILIVVLAFLIERALAPVFEHRLFIKWFDDMGLKEPLSLLVSFAVVRFWNFDALSVLFQQDRNSIWGFLITAAIIAGGSKASVKLFHDLLGVRSSAEKARMDKKRKAAATGGTEDPLLRRPM